VRKPDSCETPAPVNAATRVEERRKGTRMDIEKQKEIDALLARLTLGRLATASPSGQPHVVPVWFL